MRTVLIPNETDPFVVKINNDVYSYPAGTEQSVPDKVADLIDNYWELQPKQAKAVDGGMLPYVSEINDGEHLTVTDGAWTASKVTELPEVTIADAGKTLVVDDEGKIVAGEAGGGDLFIVRLTENENGDLTCDKTFLDIFDAVTNGKIPYMWCGLESDEVYFAFPMSGKTSTEIVFSITTLAIQTQGNFIARIGYSISSSNEITSIENFIPLS